MNPVATLEDLKSRECLDIGSAKPARLAVIGWPVSHSASPNMHQPALDEAGVNARYIRLEVEPGMIPKAFARLRELGFIGCNVTVPHKLDALCECDVVDPAARALGAVNTVLFDADATRGFNTDGPGFEAAVAESLGISLRGTKVIIAGAGGGAGQAIATQCALAGATRLVLVNRTLSKLAPMQEKLRQLAPDVEVIAISFDDPLLKSLCLESELVVNTSSVGLQQGDPSVLAADCLSPEQAVYDTIYQPALTPLLATARSVGCRTANGKSMLLHQGALAFAHWFPGRQPLETMRLALGMDARIQASGD